MSLARSKITAQGQISVPAKVRQRLGAGPGSVLLWNEEQGRIVVSLGGAYSSKDISAALFPRGTPRRRSLEELKDGVREYAQLKHERG